MRRLNPTNVACAAGLAACLLTPSCNSTGTETDNPIGPSGVEFRHSSLPYEAEAAVSDATRQALRESNQAFALGLFREVAARMDVDENVFLGAHSVATVLAMTYAGAHGTTESEMATVLQHTLSQAEYHPAMNALAQALRAGTENTSVRYESVNSLWLADDHATQDPFLDVLSQHYDTGAYLVDFEGDSASARESINSWVDEATEGLVDEFFPVGSIGPATELALANAAYLSAPWQDRFDPERTTTSEFSLPDGNVVEVPMMDRQYEYPFVLDIDWRALELPFHQANMGMVFVLPNPGEYAELEAGFDSAFVQEVVAGLEAWHEAPETVTVQVPRFEFSSEVDLGPSLEALGMVSAFEVGAADFTRIDPEGELYVETFVHQTTVGVDENGTTMAAATGEILVPSPIAPIVSLDRPFLFFVYDHGTGSVLFVGRFIRPEGEARPPAEPPDTNAEVICGGLSGCSSSDRTTTEAECLAALAAEDSEALKDCADCIQLGVDSCGGYAGCGGVFDVCQPSTCADYCPTYAF